MRTGEMLRVTVTVQDREDGGVHVHSPDVPGLHLSGADRRQVWAMVAPAIKHLLEANRGVRARAVFLPEEVLDAPEGPREVRLNVQRETELMVELAA